MVHALGSDGVVFGTFQKPLPEKSHTIGCGTMMGADTLTHSDPKPRSSLAGKWMPPNDFKDKIVHFR